MTFDKESSDSLRFKLYWGVGAVSCHGNLEDVYDGGEVALVPPHDGEAGEADQQQGAGHHPLASVRSETAAVSRVTHF